MSTQIKFLIVDDVPENLVAIEALLRRDGLETLLARSGAEALELLLVHEVSLALLDVQMPEMDGFELAELMRGTERTRHVPIIFLTAGHRDQQRAFRGYEHGAVDFLFKPIDSEVLRSKASVFFDLACQRSQLVDALRVNELFVGILGHDLRNPLAVLVAGAEVLKRQITEPGQLRNLERMSSAGQRMTTMIDQLLDLTRIRIGDGLGVGMHATVDVHQLIQRVRDEFRMSSPQTEVMLHCVGESSILGDQGRLLQLFSNLMGNAIQHGGREVPVTARLACSPSHVVVAIHNAGTIPSQVMTELFEPFRGRGERSSHPAGLGLGLYISRQIARAHRGDIAVHSDESGTTFTVELPRR